MNDGTTVRGRSSGEGRGRRRAGSASAAGLLALATGLAALVVPLVPAAAGAGPPLRPAPTTLLEPASTGTAAAQGPAPSVADFDGAPAGAARTAAPKPGSGGWYWPIGTEDYHGWSGWLEPRGAYLHIAQDMPCSLGHPVYAIGGGVVFIARADAGGYGAGGAPGGCIIIVHTTAAGEKFRALYGHVSGLLVKEGERVSPGEVIATVNGCRHLHFSIHPSATYRDGNPYAGHVPKSWADHGGFVDPVRYLKTNPAAADYLPPALPRAEIATTSAPFQYGAAAGAAYWTEEGAAGTVTYRYDLSTQERRVLDPGVPPPAFDATRYSMELLVAPALGFVVSDHLPALDLTATHSTPEWGAPAQLAATLTSSSGAPLLGAIVRLDLLDGGKWRQLRLGVTDGPGSALFDVAAESRTTLRATFTPPAGQAADRTYLGVQSRSLTVTPHVRLTPPTLPATVRVNDLVTVAGYLAPLHTAGGNSVDLVFQRRGAGGAWVTKLTVDAMNRDAGSQTHYVGSVRLPAAGTWRVQATHPPDGEHAQTYSTWRSFTVK